MRIRRDVSNLNRFCWLEYRRRQYSWRGYPNTRKVAARSTTRFRRVPAHVGREPATRAGCGQSRSDEELTKLSCLTA